MSSLVKMDRGDILSAEELRNRLYLKFKRNGILDNLRSQLRKKLVSELDGKTLVNKKSRTSEETSALLLQVLNWLIGDHLKTYEYNYTLSVFAAEIGTLNQAEEMFSLKDIFHLLNINTKSEIYENLISTNPENREKSLLFFFIQMIGLKTNEETKENSSQTEMEKMSVAHNLQIKLQQIEDFYVLKRSASKMEFEGSLENQLVKYKKMLEERLRKELKDELQSFKDQEILNIKIEEREKCREELKIKMKQVEKEHRDKMEEIVQKEMKWRQQMDAIKESLDRETFNQRQEILSQLDTARQQELDGRRIAEKMRIDLEMEKNKFENFSVKLKMRETELNEKEKLIEERVRQLVSQERFDERQELSERIRQLNQRETELENKKLELEKETAEYCQLKSQVEEKNDQFEEMKNNLMISQEREGNLQQQNSILMESVKRLETTANAELREMTADRDRLVLKVHSLNSQLNAPSAQVLSLKRELETERDSRRLDRGLWDEQRRRFNAKLDAALDNNKSLASRIDQVVAINSHLESIIDNLRVELRRFYFQDQTLHAETFYDTSLDGSRLPPELQLQMYSWTPPDARLAALERETEQLHKRIQHIRIPNRQFERMWDHHRHHEEESHLNSTRIDDEQMSKHVQKKFEDERKIEDIENRTQSNNTTEKNRTQSNNTTEKNRTQSNNTTEKTDVEDEELVDEQVVDQVSAKSDHNDDDNISSVEAEKKTGQSEKIVDSVEVSTGTVNLDALWEQNNLNVDQDVNISAGDESQNDDDAFW